jgi:hypothetical protein
LPEDAFLDQLGQVVGGLRAADSGELLVRTPSQLSKLAAPEQRDDSLLCLFQVVAATPSMHRNLPPKGSDGVFTRYACGGSATRISRAYRSRSVAAWETSKH